MKKTALLLLAAAGALALQQGIAADDDSPSIATVNGVDIPESRIALYAQGEQITDANRDVIIQNMITSELIAQAAKEAGIDDRAEVREQLAIAEQTVLGRVYVGEFFSENPIDDDRIEARYEELAEQAKSSQEYDAAHILVEDEGTAKQLLAQLNEADDAAQTFAQLARENSKDPGSAANGGKLGWVAPQSLVPEFAAAMQQLDGGALSAAPVKTSFGWHIIRVDARREAQVPPLTPQLRQRIEQGERADLFSKHIEELRAAADIELR